MATEPEGQAGHAEYGACIEVRASGRRIGQLVDLPGCYAVGSDEGFVLRALTGRIPAYYDWLRQHDEYTPMVAGPFAVVAREVVPTETFGDVEAGAFFQSDAAPLTDEDLDWLLAQLDWAYDDLTSAVHHASEADLDRPVHGSRSARDVLESVARRQMEYLGRIDGNLAVSLADAPPGTIRDHVRWAWQIGMERVRATDDRQRERVREELGERWTLRKVLRRSILLVRQANDTVHGAGGA